MLWGISHQVWWSVFWHNSLQIKTFYNEGKLLKTQRVNNRKVLQKFLKLVRFIMNLLKVIYEVRTAREEGFFACHPY